MRRAHAPALLALIVGCSSPAPAPPPVQDTPPPVAPAVTQVVVRLPEPTAAVREDVEPNNDRSQAMPLTLGVATQGRIPPPTDPKEGDEDWYVVTVPGDAQSILSVSLEGPDDLDVVLEWMPAQAGISKDAPLIQADVIRKRPGDEILPNLRVSPGPVFLRVRGAWYRNKPRQGSEQPYTLTADLLPWEPTLEAEPNNTPADAVQAVIDRPTRGIFDHIRDRDTWRIATPVPPKTRVRLSVSGVPGIRMEANVSWEGQSAPPITARGAKGDGIVLRNLGVPPGESPALLLTLRSLEGAAPRSPYDLQVRPEEPVDGIRESEPNDGTSTASTVAANKRVFGYLDRRGDVDTFRLTVDEATGMHITLSPPLGTNVELELLGPDGASVATSRSAAKGAVETLRGIGLTPGAWYAVVRGKPADSRQPYLLELVTHEVRGTEREPNDDPGKKDLIRLEPNQSASGWLHPAGDVDCWVFERPQSQGSGIMTFQLDPPKGARLDISVLDASGQEVTGRKGLTAAQPGTFTHFLPAGRYTVRISASDPDATSADAYALRLLD